MGIRRKENAAVFIDRDGTLIHEKNYLSRPEDVRLYAGAVPALKLLNASGFRVVMVTNQSGIGRGYFTEKDLGRVHRHLRKMLKSSGITLDAIYYCPHSPEAGCGCRKPNLGMVKRAERELSVDLSRSFTIGDHPGDYLLGKKMGGKGVFVLTGHGRKEYAKLASRTDVPWPDKVFPTLLAAARWIVKQRGNAA